MNTLRPVDPGYDPGYPRRLGESELRALLRRSLLERFSGATILSGALLAGCLPQVLAQEPASRPQAGRLPRPPRMAEAAFAKELTALTAELMGGSKGGFWDAHSSIALARPLPSNPPVKCPRIRISFGNSYVGIFDVEAAKQATRKLFAHYGVPLQEGVRVAGDGFQFMADGYDPERKVGFKIRVPAGQVERGKVAPAEPAERALEDQELAAVDRAVAKGELKLFVVDGTAYPNMDNDLYTPMQYYLSSVVDYLNWVHGEERIDPATVLGRLPGWVRGEHEPAPSFLPGGAFTEEADLKHWNLTKGHAGRSDRWCEPGGSCLRVELAPGGEACYLVPANLVVELGGERRAAMFKLHVDGGDSSLVQVTGLGARGEALELRLHADGVRHTLFPAERMRLHALRLRSQSKAPVTFYLRDLSW